MSALKPCPFCGGEAIFEEEVNPGYFKIKCPWTLCIGKFVTLEKEQAIKAWNTRSDARLERLQEAAQVLVTGLNDKRTTTGYIKSVLDLKYSRKFSKELCKSCLDTIQESAETLAAALKASKETG